MSESNKSTNSSSLPVENTISEIKCNEEKKPEVEVLNTSVISKEISAPEDEKNVQNTNIISEVKPESSENFQDIINANLLPEATPVLQKVEEVKWEEREQILKEKITALEKKQTEGTNTDAKIQNLERDLQIRTEERENYKNKVQLLETELNDSKNTQPNTLNSAQQNAIYKMKQQSEELLTKAKGVIFDKTKLIKHQELQIEALTLQITSLKEVLSITKELLEIRNFEVKELEEKLNFMDQKIMGEKQRHDLMHQKMDTMVKMNSELKVEYETQLQLFEALRTQYVKRDEIEGNNPPA